MSSVILTDAVLDGLLARADHAQIPCLQFLIKSPAHKPCNCTRAPKTETRVNGEQARICISQLPPERLWLLKKALGTERVVIYMTTPGFPKRTVL